MNVPVNFYSLRKANRSRLVKWHTPDTEPWTIVDWSNAMCGEAGETANIVKKIRRHHTHITSKHNYNTPELSELFQQLADELADTIIYADLLAYSAGIDLSQAVREKFNRTSQKQNFPERI